MSAGDVTSAGTRPSATLPHGNVTDGVSVSGRRSSGDHDDEVTTTTSGSYTTDRARELCSEIDQIFFSSSSTNVWHHPCPVVSWYCSCV